MTQQESKALRLHILTRLLQNMAGLKGILSVCLLVLVVGCTQTKSFKSSNALEVNFGDVSNVLLMPADVELSELDAAGINEPNAAWTEQGRHNLETALRDTLAQRQAQMVNYKTGANPTEIYAPEHLQIVKLHGAVGRSILLHKYTPVLELPTKKDRFDWTLGDSVRALREEGDVRYALFLYARDSFTSAGRAALMVAAALFGVGLQGGHQEAFISLVDLQTGNIVWFNFLRSGAGDLRTIESAREAMDKLLEGAPL